VDVLFGKDLVWQQVVTIAFSMLLSSISTDQKPDPGKWQAAPELDQEPLPLNGTCYRRQETSKSYLAYCALPIYNTESQIWEPPHYSGHLPRHLDSLLPN